MTTTTTGRATDSQLAAMLDATLRGLVADIKAVRDGGKPAVPHLTVGNSIRALVQHDYTRVQADSEQARLLEELSGLTAAAQLEDLRATQAGDVAIFPAKLITNALKCLQSFGIVQVAHDNPEEEAPADPDYVQFAALVEREANDAGYASSRQRCIAECLRHGNTEGLPTGITEDERRSAEVALQRTGGGA